MDEDAIIRANEGLVYLIVKRYRAREDFEDIQQEARSGVLTAARKYDPARGKFSTYAAHWIRSRVGRYMADRIKHSGFTDSLDDSPLDGGSPLVERIVDDREDAYAQVDARLLAESLLAAMRPCEAEVIRKRGRYLTLQEVGEETGVTRQCVAQIERAGRRRALAAMERAR
jgi:RNA polymerase sigma factor (sigma-70 family)